MDKKKIMQAGKAVDATSSTVGTVFKVIGTFFLIFIVTGLLFTCIFAYYVKTCITPSIDIDLDDFTLNQSSTIWYADSNGDWQELVTLSGKENRRWVDYEEIPWYMEKALVAIEDKRFYTHKGVDWYRTVGAFGNMFLSMKDTFGGSTITQQLIKNLTQQDDITVQRKLLEIFQALEFEKEYDKSEIIEWYLNVVYFGEGCYGVQTAAQTYFGKDVSELSLAECAAIVGITNKPTYYDPFYSVENNKSRQLDVLWCMYDQGYITKEEYEEAKAEELNFVRGENVPWKQTIYSYYTETVIDDVISDLAEEKGISTTTARQLLYNAGYNVYCCLDMDMQNIVDSVYENVDALPKSNSDTSTQLQSAIVIMDPYTGEIKALSGGTGEKTINFGLNRATGALRPPGSSIKPLSVYAPAVEYGLITPSTLIADLGPDKIQLKGTSWYPSNYNNAYDGIITIYQALTVSKNTASAQILDKLTPAASFDFMTGKLGFTSLIDEDCNYAALALGQPNYGVTVREMAQAYCTFPNDGTFTYSRTYSKVLASDNETVILDNEPETQTAFSARTAHVMTYMLESSGTSGISNKANIGDMPVAGKTGTTSDYKDRYFCGFTPYYVAAVWTGYDQGENMNFSSNPSVTIWQMIMSQIHANLEPKDFTIEYGGGATNIFGTEEELNELAEEDEDEDETDDGDTDDGAATPSNAA